MGTAEELSNEQHVQAEEEAVDGQDEEDGGEQVRHQRDAAGADVHHRPAIEKQK